MDMHTLQTPTLVLIFFHILYTFCSIVNALRFFTCVLRTVIIIIISVPLRNLWFRNGTPADTFYPCLFNTRKSSKR